MSATFTSCNLRPQQTVHKGLVSLDGQGHGRVDWIGVEEEFGGIVKLQPGGRPSLERSGRFNGYTMEHIAPRVYTVTIQRGNPGEIIQPTSEIPIMLSPTALRNHWEDQQAEAVSLAAHNPRDSSGDAFGVWEEWNLVPHEGHDVKMQLKLKKMTTHWPVSIFSGTFGESTAVVVKAMPFGITSDLPWYSQVARETFSLAKLRGAGAPYLPAFISEGLMTNTHGDLYEAVIITRVGKPLETCLNWRYPGVTMDISHALRLMACLMAACLSMLKAGVKHGDIKPDQVVLDGNLFALVDFGFSKVPQELMEVFRQRYPQHTLLAWPLVHDRLFSSLETLQKLPPTVMSDFESSVYLVVHLLNNGLPWTGVTSLEECVEGRKEARTLLHEWASLRSIPDTPKRVLSWILSKAGDATVSLSEISQKMDLLFQHVKEVEGIALCAPSEPAQPSPGCGMSTASRLL